MSINPQTIDPNFLPSLPLEQRKALPFISAIYLAIDSQGVVQYVGRSRNLNRRWVQHHRLLDLAHLFEVKIAWLEVSDTELLPEIEKSLICWFNPPLNQVPVVKPEIEPQLPCAYVDISKYWPEGESVNAVYEDQLMRGRKIYRRTLASAKEGKLFKSDYIILVYLRDFAREQSGDENLAIDDLLAITEDESDS